MNHDLRRLISSIESRLTVCGGTLVYYGSSVHFGGLDKLLQITKDILRSGSNSLDSEGNGAFLPFVEDVLFSHGILIEMEAQFDKWIKDKMAHSLFSESISILVSKPEKILRFYDEDSLLRCPISVENLLVAAKCLDEQDLPTLLALDLQCCGGASESLTSPPTNHDEQDEDEIFEGYSCARHDEDEDEYHPSTSCPEFTALAVRKFLKSKDLVDEAREASSLDGEQLLKKEEETKPLPPELERIIRARLENYNSLGARPKTGSFNQSDVGSSNVECSENSNLNTDGSPPKRGAEVRQINSEIIANLNLTPVRSHRRAFSDTSVFQMSLASSEIQQRQQLRQTERSSSGDFDSSSEHNWSTVTPPTDGWMMPLPRENESLYSYLSSGAFSRHQARLDRENAHIILAEIIIQATTKRAGESRCRGSNGEFSTLSSDAPSNQQRNNSAESVALALLNQFDDKHETKASELNWIVGDHQTPQELLPLPPGFVLKDANYEENNTLADDQTDGVVCSQATELRGTHDWAPPRPQLILQLHPRKSRSSLLSEQKYRCAGCSMSVEKKYSKTYRYCHYFGKLFCTGCHSNENKIIPSNVINKWDFKEYPVSDFASTVLISMNGDPLFNVQDLNPDLIRKVSKLKKAIEIRSSSVGIYPFIKNCRHVPEYVSDIDKFPVIDPHVFSLNDLCRIKSENYTNSLRTILDKFTQHILKCSLCYARGFICEGCRSLDVLFPFEAEVYQCPHCYACYHRPCFSSSCTKCLRINERKNARTQL